MYRAIGDWQLRTIRREDIKEIVATMTRKGLSAIRISQAHLVIAHTLRVGRVINGDICIDIDHEVVQQLRVAGSPEGFNRAGGGFLRFGMLRPERVDAADEAGNQVRARVQIGQLPVLS